MLQMLSLNRFSWSELLHQELPSTQGILFFLIIAQAKCGCGPRTRDLSLKASQRPVQDNVSYLSRQSGQSEASIMVM